MRPLNSGYARYYNRKVGRRGYLFQDRYKSVATQDQGYTERLIRYVHLNPVRSGICTGIGQLDIYPWCSHGAVAGTLRSRCVDTRTVLRRFGRTTPGARKQYRAFLQDGIDSPERSLVDTLQEVSSDRQDRMEPAIWVIGDPAFVRRALRSDSERRVRLSRFKAQGWDLERLCTLVAKGLGIQPASVLQRGRGDKRSAARKIVAYLGYRRLDIPVSTIARHLGIGQPAVSSMLAHGERLSAELQMAISD
jgi:hypothetical protein